MTAILITAVSGAGILTADALEYDFDKIDKDLAEDVETHHIPAMAVIVVDKDKVLFCKTYGGCKSEDTPFIIGSMSKSFAVSLFPPCSCCSRRSPEYRSESCGCLSRICSL